MIANLPLLFANGNPTALSKLTVPELEKFITFMVTCSWGHDTAKDIRQPPWWPDNVAFSHPFVKPNEVPKDWEVKLKNLVKKCYDYHKSTFLLVFSAQLSRYPRKRLRYVDNRDHTTSLYYRPNGRLLVTFRNENIFYDRAAPIEIDDDPVEVSVQSANIYLCDNCDSHFDNFEILRVHERLCNNEDFPQRAQNASRAELPEFLSALKLQAIGQKSDPPKGTEPEFRSRNVRSAANIDRGPPYPFSSLAYMKNVKSNVQRDTNYSRERIERYCSPAVPVCKNVGSKSRNHQFPVRYRRPIDYWQRKHVFPNQRNKDILDLNSQLMLLKCRSFSVNVERMSEESIKEYIDNLKKSVYKVECIEDKDVVLVDGVDCDQPAMVEMKICDPLKKSDNDCEVIDLCSDDETPSANENCDPRAGVTCVMRGGAVLRRTAATPLSLPSEPCGARERPLPPAVLQPHPVILIAHSLNNLQTISID